MNTQPEMRPASRLVCRVPAGPARRWSNILPQARWLGAALAGAALMTIPAVSPATPLSLSQSPLFLSGTVQPNVFFLADDSGSMDWNMVTKEADGVMRLTAGGTTIAYSYLFPQADNAYAATSTNGRILPTEAAITAFASIMPADKFGVWRGRYSGYNTLYYNPEARYLPWEGVDAAGVAYGNATPTAVRLNPYITTGGSNVINLTANMSWSADRVPNTAGAVMSGNARNSGNSSNTIGMDSGSSTAGFYNGMTITIYNGTGAGQTRTVTGYTGGTSNRVATVSPNWTTVPATDSDYSFGLPVTSFYPAMYYTWTDTDSDGVIDATDAHTAVNIVSGNTYAHTSGNRTDCANPLLCTYAEEIVNFANWFQYYRRRILTSKSAIGAVIAPSSARMGLATLHNNGTVNTQISLMNSSVSSGNKKTLLDAVYKNTAGSDTPLRTKLDEAGKYFECVSGNIFGLAAGTSCPILPAASGGSCQKNFTVLMTDGYYNDAFSFASNPHNRDGDINTTFDGGAYKDNWSDTLADVAMNYYERDLSSTLANQVFPVPGVDIATHQHMVTYTVAFGVDGTLTANPPNTTAPFSWPNPTLGDAQKIDDLRHAAYNGRGKFLSAKDPISLRDALGAALGHITGLLGSASSVAVNSHILSTTTTVYQARFTSGEWSGDLRALPVSTTGVIGTELWSAAAQLKAQNWNTGRQIITHNGTSGTAFRWANLSSAQQASLNDDPTTPAVDNDSRGSNRLNWLRGDATNETTSPAFRRRLDSYGSQFKLGDLINSSPVYVGAPGFLPDSIETGLHSTFASAFATRANIIYVGGNDGMLHGFDAATGNEVLGYVPAVVFPDLSKLTDPAYTHRYYVDGSPVSGDVYGAFAGCTTAPCWRTVLVSGLGGGGKGYYALDITDPSKFSSAESATNAAKIALWEISAATDNDLGYTFAQPTITKVNVGAGMSKWVAIFGNGYNSTNESAALYVVDMENGTVLRKIVVDAGGGTSGNGLSTPAVYDDNGDYIADYVYAGDLKGNLWKFNLATGDSSTWGVSYGTAGTPQPMFRAVDSTGVAQPITERPAVSKATTPLTHGAMVYFGTGRYLDDGDKAPPANPTHTFYGIWDQAVASTTVPVTRTDLLPQTIGTTTVNSFAADGVTVVSTTTVRSITDNPITYRQSGSTACAADGSGECLGWRVDLPATGEMSVANPVLLTADVVDMPRIIFSTLVPGSDACSAGGTSWLMELDPTNGGPLSSPYIDANGDGVIDAADSTPAGVDLGIGIVQEPVVIYDPAAGLVHKVFSGSTGAVANAKQSGDTVPPAPSTPGIGARKSWRQIK